MTMLRTSPTDQNVRTYNGYGMRVKSLSREYQCGGIQPKATSNAKSATTAAGASGSATAGRWVTTNNTHYFHADDGSLLGEYDLLSGSHQETIWFNGQPVATMMDGTLYYVRSDHLGTPRSIARPSDNAEVWRWDSDPFGNGSPTLSGGVYLDYSLRFPGQQYDRYSGYFYNWMRDYDPVTGRYLQADPLGLGGGLSRYAYVGANPLSRIDPMGLAGVAFTFGGDLTIGRGFTAGSGGYFALDTMTSGAMTFTGDSYGLSGGVNASATFFAGSGTSLLDGSATNYSVSVFALTLGVTFSNNPNSGLFGVTALTVGVGEGLPIGATVSTTDTVLRSGGLFRSPPPQMCSR